jgi:hypothetical protein
VVAECGGDEAAAFELGFLLGGPREERIDQRTHLGVASESIRWAEATGVRQKSWLFLMRLMHAGRDFAMLCAQQDTTWFLAANVAAFTHFAGIVAGRRGSCGHASRRSR